MGLNNALEDDIVRRAHRIFDTLPKRCKPRDSLPTTVEWAPLSAIAVADGKQN